MIILTQYPLIFDFLPVKLSDPATEDKGKISIYIIIGACGGVFCLLLIAICLIRSCKRRQKINRARVANGLPPDVAFPNPEKYEMSNRKEDIVRYEEVKISAIGIRYEELGIPNEAVHYEKLSTSNDGARYQAVGTSTFAGNDEEIGISNDAATYEEVGTPNKAMQQ